MTRQDLSPRKLRSLAGRGSAWPAGRRVAGWPRTAGAAAALLALSGCMGDPPPDPSSAPLEVVLEGCVLNRSSVQAGTHSVAVVGSGRVTVTDPGGGVLLTARGGEPTPAEITVAAGSYGVTCEPEGGRTAEAELRVDPAG